MEQKDDSNNKNKKQKEIDHSPSESSSYYTDYSLARASNNGDDEDEDLDFKLDQDVLPRSSRVSAGKKIRKPSVDTQRNLDIGQHQWQYNDCRLTLARSITSVLHLLHSLESSNRSSWATHINDPNDFKVLRLDLKDQGTNLSTLIKTLDDKAVSSLVDRKITQVVKHLLSLRERIEDTSSKVLVTGDLNAGKSTLCNALLQQPLLTTDQQPCTNLFCEVLDAARSNNGIEECHAVLKGHEYDKRNELTYDKVPIDKISDIVERNDLYTLLKVYIIDKRPLDESLLRNGVCDIALIDAPGLNIDSIHTTAVFARQEEIDVVVFVVNAENHFTQSAKEFIQNAAKEKSYIFIIVNKFDTIRNKDKCRRLIMDQLDELAPRTKQDAKNLVHFVNSEQSVPDDDDDDGDPGPSRRSPPDDDDFNRLEACLRNFVLEKRSLSKLAPVKTYLLNLLQDLTGLASVNLTIASNNMENLDLQLKNLSQQLEESESTNASISQEMENDIDESTLEVYNYSKQHLTRRIQDTLDNCSKLVEYKGIFSCLQYACEIQDEIVDKIGKSVVECEEYARNKTSKSFNTIKSIGLQQFGDSYVEKIFQSHLMFTRRRDMLGKNLDVELNLGDFVDFYEGYSKDGVISSKASTTAALTLATVAGGGQLLSLSTIMSNPSKIIMNIFQVIGIKNIHKLILPLIGIGIFGIIGYAIYDVPNAISRRIGFKIRKELIKLDYIQENSQRISNECLRVLSYPKQDIFIHFQRKIDSINKNLIDARCEKHNTDNAYDVYNLLLEDANEQLEIVKSVDLESLVN